MDSTLVFGVVAIILFAIAALAAAVPAVPGGEVLERIGLAFLAATIVF